MNSFNQEWEIFNKIAENERKLFSLRCYPAPKFVHFGTLLTVQDRTRRYGGFTGRDRQNGTGRDRQDETGQDGNARDETGRYRRAGRSQNRRDGMGGTGRDR